MRIAAATRAMEVIQGGIEMSWDSRMRRTFAARSASWERRSKKQRMNEFQIIVRLEPQELQEEGMDPKLENEENSMCQMVSAGITLIRLGGIGNALYQSARAAVAWLANNPALSSGSSRLLSCWIIGLRSAQCDQSGVQAWSQRSLNCSKLSC